MIRRLVITACLLLAAASAEAQGTQARRRVPPGEVTGLEMRIEGGLSAPPGGRVRWFVTLYEVVRRRDLRPAPDATLRVLASFAPGEPVQVVRTDAAGHAAIEVPFPDDLERAPHLRVEAVSPRNVRRVFSVGLQLAGRHRMELFVDRDHAPPGGEVAAIGRLRDAATGRPVAGEEVRLRVAERGAVGAPTTVTTDARGVFFAPALRLPDAPGPGLQIRAESEHALASRGLTVEAPSRPARWVEVEAPPLVAPGARFDVAVHVRGLDGEPVRGARVAWRDRTAEEREDPPRPTTDAEGRARLPWTAPTSLAEPWRDLARTLLVTDPGAGAVEQTVTVRVARVPALVAWAVDGGALAPGLGGRVFVRVVRPDGTPWVGPVALELARFGATRNATTDADGVARFDGTVALGGDGGGCGGSTATEATLVVGEHRERLCLPIDPDATVRIAEARLGASDVTVSLERIAAVRGASVEVSALVRAGDGWLPVARVHAGPREAEATLALPDEARGEIWLRARPLVDDGVPVRGGSRLIERPHAGGAPRLEASEAGASVAADGDATVAAFASESGALLGDVRAAIGPVAAAREAGRTEAFLAALLAARTPNDTSASMTLRGAERVPQPMPEQPVAEGLLRDPWRTRARFVRGRLGRLMRSVELLVDGAIPDSMDDVAVREGGRWRFNQAILTPAVEEQGLGEETATGLDGEPLDIDTLAAMDPSFTFDHVARRITRERLWRMLVVLREAVMHLGLDRPWARRGDPSELPISIFEIQDQLGLSTYLSREHLFDAWGQPFALRPVRGRSRFRFLEPVEGWELVSPGPDGRAGTGDDVVDPFARVLPSGGIYADAVGEDVLLARLTGVALGRATLESLREVFSIEPVEPSFESAAAAHATWGSLPAPASPAASRAPALSPLAAPIGGLGASPTWTLPSARRAYRATALRFGADGGLDAAEARFVAGAPWIATLELPVAMRPSEALRVPIGLVRLADAPPPTVEAQVSGRGVEARVEGTRLVLRATAPGLADLTVTVRAGERVVSRFERRLRVVPPGLLRERARVALVTREAELSPGVPERARPWRGELVVGAPNALYADPSFVRAVAEAPGVLAWARAMADAAPDEALLAAATSDDGVLETACAAVAWASREDHASRVAPATAGLAERLGDDLALRASVLAALAPWAPAAPTGSDAPAQLVAALREDGWRALATASDDPAVMARMAAALLLADRDDGRGRALLERAAGALEEDPHGRRFVPGDPARLGDAWIGTLALAVAARQAGDDALADELAGAALTRLHLADRTGPEGAFWALAASVYGAFGIEGPEAVEVVVDGRPSRLALEGGVTRLAVAPSATVRLSTTAPVWARVAARYLAPVEARDEGPLRARIEGTPGRAGETAGYELVVENPGDAERGHPIVEVVLPGAAGLDAETLAAMSAGEDVASVDAPDGANVLRIRLAPLAAGGERRVPLAWRWLAAGRTRGLDLVAYDGSIPHAMFVREGRTLTVEEAP